MTDYPPPPDRPTPGADQPGYGSYPSMPSPGQPAGQQPYGQPYGGYPQGYGQGYGGGPRNGLGLAGMIVGIVAIPATLIYVGIIPSVVALVLGLIGRGRVRRQEATNPGQALTAVILGTVGIVLFVVYVVVVVSFVHRHCHRDAGGQLVCTRYGT